MKVVGGCLRANVRFGGSLYDVLCRDVSLLYVSDIVRSNLAEQQNT